MVRREAWQAHVPETLVLAGRVGGSMLAGEDLEALLHLQQAQWQIWYNPAMVVHHRIPRSRLEADYLKKLFFGIGLSRYRTRMLSFPAWQRPGALVLYALNDGRKILRHLLRHRRQVQTDVVAACEMQLYWASLISPLFFLVSASALALLGAIAPYPYHGEISAWILALPFAPITARLAFPKS